MAGNLIQTLQQAGFQGPALQKAWAIAMRESGGNPNAFNGNASTGDKSYGLFQINMLGNLGPARLKQYGLTSDQQLLDPTVNARVAYAMSKGGTDFGAWGIGPNAYKGAPAAAYQRYQQLLGRFPGAKGSTPMQLGGGLTAAMQAQAGGGGGSSDARKAALMSLIQSNNAFITGQDPTTNPLQTLQMLQQAMSGGNGGGQSFDLGGGNLIKGVNPADPADMKAVKLAQHFLGTPYQWGGSSPGGFDCSGLLQYVWSKNGVNIPRTTYDQFQAGRPVSQNALRPGDAVFFKGSDSITRNGQVLPGHVGMYIGNGKFIEAPHTGASVQISTLAGYPGYMGARRYG